MKLLSLDAFIGKRLIYRLTFTLMTEPYDNQIEISICNRKHERKKGLPRKDVMMHLLEPIFKFVASSCSLIFPHFPASYPYTSHLSHHSFTARLFLVYLWLVFGYDTMKWIHNSISNEWIYEFQCILIMTAEKWGHSIFSSSKYGSYIKLKKVLVSNNKALFSNNKEHCDWLKAQ